ncbi:EH domain-containing protein 4 [Grus japonensis]|uniref:EH domain-containing protein 4 n=1 Tax=Grus japonensis TaxID=30415 RepID=A0ABC9W4E2_GRUJA
MAKTMVRQAVPLQPMEDPTPEQVDAPEGGCDPVGSPRCSRLLAGPVDPWREEPTLEQVCWQDLGPHGGPMLEQFMKNCSLWEGLTLEKFMEDCLPWEGPNAGAGEECEESSP